MPLSMPSYDRTPTTTSKRIDSWALDRTLPRLSGRSSLCTHDDAGRLTGADHPSGGVVPDESYTYDDAGRRTSTARDTSTDVVYTVLDQLEQDAVYSDAYDNEGRLTHPCSANA